MTPVQGIFATVGLLVCSNVFMTYAWYYHVKQAKWWLLTAIVASWLIALPEYVLQVPANRIGHVDHGGPLGLPQLKIMQGAITLMVFCVFTVLVAKERLKGTDVAAMGLVMLGVGVSIWGRMKLAAGEGGGENQREG